MSSTPFSALLVDPTQASTRMLEAQLEELGLGCRQVPSLGAAFAELESHRPKLIVASFQLGSFRATSLLEALRADARWRSIPVIVLTSDLQCRSAFAREHPDALLLRNEYLLQNLQRCLEELGVGSAGSGSAGNHRVLVAEDTNMNRLLLSRVLNLAGYEVVATENGQEALDEARGGTFEAMIFDVEMPVMTGPEAVAKLRAEGSRAPILALTGHDSEEAKRELLASGFDEVHPKPFDQQQLLQWIEAQRDGESVDLEG